MDMLVVAFWFVFGAIIGSFLNALSFRWGTGATMGGRSKCFSCGVVLGARDLVPIFSYFALAGRCRSCKARISLQYPAVELLAGLIGVLTYMAAGEDPLQLALAFLFWNTLLFILIYDLRHKIIPDRASILASLLALIAVLTTEGLGYQALLAGPLLAAPLLALSLLSGGKFMGLGDGKLMLSLGWFLGLTGGFIGLLFAFWTGALVAGVLLIRSLEGGSGRHTMKSEVPFAPFLIFGAGLVYFTDAEQFITSFLF